MIAEADVLARASEALRAGDLARAEQELATLFGSGKPSVAALLLMSDVQRLRGLLPEAEELARQAADTDESGRALGKLAALLQVQGRFDEARRAYKEALRRDPRQTAVRLNYVRCLFAMERYGDVVKEAEALLQQGANTAAYILQSDAQRMLGALESAIAAANRALALAPDDRGARMALARALDAAGRFAESVNAYRPLAASEWQSVDEALGYAHALWAAGELKEAEQSLERAADKWPAQEQVLAALCKARWANGAGAAFVEPMARAVAAHPSDARLRMSCANLLYRAEQYAEAETLLLAGLDRNPSDASLLASLAVVLDNAGKPADALAMYDRACSLAPYDEQLRANRAAALLRLGRADEALAELAPLRERRPLAQDLIAREALALRMMGRPRYHELYNYERFVRRYELPTPTGFASLQEFNLELGERLRRLLGNSEHPLEQSLRNGSQTRENLALSTDPIIRRYIETLEVPIRDYVAALPDDPNDPMGSRKSGAHRIWGCWAVRLRPGGFHVNHVHPEGWISSAYYVHVPKRAASDNPHAGWIKFGEPDLPVPGCDAELFVEPAAGAAVLFPSYMWHGTVPFSQGERITAPFDVVPV